MRRVSGASAHYKPISRYQLIFTFDSAAALMGAGTRVSVHRSLNNVMKPGADLIYNPTPWLNSIMSFFFPPPPFFRENGDYGMTLTYSGGVEATSETRLIN